MVVYFLANVGVERFQAVCCKRDGASWSTVWQAWFSLAPGMVAIWWSATSLLNRYGLLPTQGGHRRSDREQG